MKKIQGQMVLEKGNEIFIFRYNIGCEVQLLDVMFEWAKNKQIDFDWFDAAVLSLRLSHSLIDQADELLEETI